MGGFVGTLATQTHSNTVRNVELPGQKKEGYKYTLLNKFLGVEGNALRQVL